MVRGDHHRRLYAALLAAAAVWCFVDVVPRGGVNTREPWAHRTDFTVYTEAGAAFFDGRDPYAVANPRGWHYLYPPLFAILVSPLHALTTEAQVAVWFALSVVMCYGCYFESRRLVAALTEQRGDRALAPPWWVGIGAMLAVLVPMLNCLQRGQVEILKLYLLLLGFRFAMTGRRSRDWWLAGVVLALPIVLKLTPLLPVGCLILFEATRAWTRPTDGPGVRRTLSLGSGVACGLGLFAIVVPATIIGWNANWHHLQTWSVNIVGKVNDVRTSDFGEAVTSVRNQSLDNASYRFGNWLAYEMGAASKDTIVDRPGVRPPLMAMDHPFAIRMILLIRLIALACLLLLVVRAASCNQRSALAAVFGLACATTFIVCPVARAPYFVLMLPAILFHSLWMVEAGHRRAGGALALIAVAFVWLHYLFLPMTGRIGLLGLGTTAWFFAASLFLDATLKKNAGNSRFSTFVPRLKQRACSPS